MSYKRNVNAVKPITPHQLEISFGHYEQLKSMRHDPGWLYEKLSELHQDATFSLSQFFNVAQAAKAMDVSEFKKHIADQKKAEPILKGRRALLTFLRKHIGKAESDLAAVRRKILRETQPPDPSDPAAKLFQFMKFQEIRNNLKQIEPKLRRDAIRWNLDRIQAVMSNPDPSDVIIADSALTELRREFAFSIDPSLEAEEKDHVEIYQAVRKRAGEINATSIKILMDAGLKDDPVSPAEHFETFPPRDDYEAALARNRIQAYERQQMKAEQDEKFAAEDAGVNLEIQDRTKRQHRA